MKTATLLALSTTPAPWLQGRRSAKTPSRRWAAWWAGGAWDSGLRRGLHLRPRTRWTPGKIGSRVAMASILGSVRAGVGHPPAGGRHRGASRRSERALQRRRRAPSNQFTRAVAAERTKTKLRDKDGLSLGCSHDVWAYGGHVSSPHDRGIERRATRRLRAPQPPGEPDHFPYFFSLTAAPISLPLPHGK
jgi:hypothetical protein